MLVNWLLGDRKLWVCVGVLLYSERALWCLLSVQAKELNLTFYSGSVGQSWETLFTLGFVKLWTQTVLLLGSYDKGSLFILWRDFPYVLEKLSPHLGEDHGTATCGHRACFVQQGVRDVKFPKGPGGHGREILLQKVYREDRSRRPWADMSLIMCGTLLREYTYLEAQGPAIIQMDTNKSVKFTNNVCVFIWIFRLVR